MWVRIKGKIYDKNIRPFIKWLTKKYPIDADITFEFLDVHGMRVNGVVCTGLASSSDPSQCRIRIASRSFEDYTERSHGFTTVLVDIAHEYRHAMQYRAGQKSLKFNDPEFEEGAGLFGWTEARAAIAEGVVEYP